MYKESAYVYALSVAAITHTVAKGCAQNIIHNCSCGVSSVSGKDTACSTNQDYGLGIADNFLNKRYADKGFSLKQQLAQHNFRAAKHVSSFIHCPLEILLATVVTTVEPISILINQLW